MNFISVSVNDPRYRVVYMPVKKKVSMTPAAAAAFPIASPTTSATPSPSASRKSIERCIGVKEEITAGHAVGFS
jgi:hypothetical protein